MPCSRLHRSMRSPRETGDKFLAAYAAATSSGVVGILATATISNAPCTATEIGRHRTVEAGPQVKDLNALASEVNVLRWRHEQLVRDKVVHTDAFQGRHVLIGRALAITAA